MNEIMAGKEHCGSKTNTNVTLKLRIKNSRHHVPHLSWLQGYDIASNFSAVTIISIVICRRMYTTSSRKYTNVVNTSFGTSADAIMNMNKKWQKKQIPLNCL